MANEFNFETMHAVLNDDKAAGSLYMAAKQLVDELDRYESNYSSRAYSFSHVRLRKNALRNALNLPHIEDKP